MADEITNSWAAIEHFIRVTKLAIDTARGAKDLMPAGAEREEVDQALSAAVSSADQAIAVLAKDLGFRLCKCKFPGTPMTFVRYDPQDGTEVVRCETCGTEFPPKLGPLDP